MDLRGGGVKGLTSLLLVSILWGTSFPAIKTVMMSVNEYTYTWVRSLIAITGLTPYLIYVYRNGRLSVQSIKGGTMAGVAYALGLWLQGWGTKYTTASNSAFITGLSVVFVHMYTGVIRGRYSYKMGVTLALSLLGLYMLTTPASGFNVGDLLVLLGSFMWAAQIILVSRYCSSDPLVFTLFEMVPALMFIFPDVMFYGYVGIDFNSLLIIAYLAIVCSDAAFALQVFGQRFIDPAVAAVIFLLEPVAASVFSYILLKEVMGLHQLMGALLILISMSIASTDKSMLMDVKEK
ncbi:MAG: DMT family transporter [Sulfolobales archaeon]|nr:DMT family transporter [Sulfolobales archaeon]